MTRFIAWIAGLALSPAISYLLLRLVAAEDDALAFVTASLWVGTPVLVVAAALRAYDEGVKRAAAHGQYGQHGSDRTQFQTTQLGHLN